MHQVSVDATYLKVPIMRSKQIPLVRLNVEKKYSDSSKFLPRNSPLQIYSLNSSENEVLSVMIQCGYVLFTLEELLNLL